ncbi:2,3-bisphosphoglycerate-independent phosphoglycerate mutase [Heracleum sosnowskyi]|uniref:2,3-bisphosphoglycerate-independent phosphoglycerate mutase n=1 Tax=Heracleum sosnowskyi TaxID=360622 RepID=A0AAD8JAD7_9APIA|nr:2,3-bisphosphoglycerate-independent phosphoglycerate mutase [Heracleum sosnowskyi]
MDIQLRFRTGMISHNLSWNWNYQKPHASPCRNSQQTPPPQNGDNNNKGDKSSTDWDKAWSSFKKQGKKSIFSQFSPNKYVTWNPRRSNYPLSEEVDPIKRTERSNLMLWTSPKFTLVLAIIIVSLLLLYTILAPMK